MFTLKNILILIGRNAIIVIIVIILCLSGIIFFGKEITRMSDEAILNNNTNSISKRKANVSEVYNTDIQIIGTNDEKIKNAFAPSDNILGFINKLDELSNKASSKQIYRFETPTTPTITNPFPISTVVYSNNFTTNISDFSIYLKKFEKLPYFTNIESFDIKSQEKIGWSGTSTASFRAILYVKSMQ